MTKFYHGFPDGSTGLPAGAPPSRSNTGGYEERFVIERVDGQPIHPDRRYMVLAFDGSDREASMALAYYAWLKRQTNPVLADNLCDHILNPKDAPKQHRY
jgi:hypothetical protein